jgi:hypothetical protein
MILTSLKVVRRQNKMGKKVPLFKFESFIVYKAKCVETFDWPMKQDR